MIKGYLAGPLFTEMEREFNALLAKKLRSITDKNGDPIFKIFLPQDASAPLIGQEGWQRKVFQLNVGEVVGSNFLIANLNGATSDDGTCFEVGLGYGNSIPIIGYRDDFRQAGPEGLVNLMLGESASAMCQNLPEIYQALRTIFHLKFEDPV